MRHPLWMVAAVACIGCGPGVFYPGSQLDNDGDGVLPMDGDCDDGEPAVAGGFTEICDGLDNDCDGLVDGRDTDLRDDDGDGADDCADCDDSSPSTFDGASEVCDGLDNDCDGEVPVIERDADSDGVAACEGDCDDDDDDASPLRAEVCDGIDNDCDGRIDEPTGDVVPRVGIAGPGGDLRAWSVAGNTLIEPDGVGVPVPGGVIGAVVAGDVDGDGVQEWLRQQIDVSDDALDEVVSVGRECAGGWGEPMEEVILLGGKSQLVAAGDLDGDGVGDVATVVLTGANAGVVQIQLGDGDGGYLVRPTEITVGAVGPGGAWAFAPGLRDLNGDGLADLLVCAEEPAGARCRLYGGQGNGSLWPGVVRAELAEIGGSVDVGDGDGDGIPDLFVAPPSGATGVSMLKGDGTGRFGSPSTLFALSDEPVVGAAVRVVADQVPVGLAVLWGPSLGSPSRELALARTDEGVWTLGPSVGFTAAAGVPGLAAVLAVSP